MREHFLCWRCKNTGRVMEEYAVFPTGPIHLGEDLVNPVAEIRMREAECPACLGFGAVGWALPRYTNGG